MTDRDRLIDIVRDIFHTDFSGTNEEGYADFADRLLANGVIVPKFKVGDKVWYITGIHGTIVKSAIVEEIIINCEGVSDLLVTSDTATFENSVDIFYKTKEEAEAKLKELGKNGN